MILYHTVVLLLIGWDVILLLGSDRRLRLGLRVRGGNEKLKIDSVGRVREPKRRQTKSALQHAFRIFVFVKLVVKNWTGAAWQTRRRHVLSDFLDRPAASGLRNWQKCIRAPAGSGGAGGRRERETHWQTAGGNETRHSYHRARERKPKIKSGKITFWYTSSSSN
jgi:hypothetical protein